MFNTEKIEKIFEIELIVVRLTPARSANNDVKMPFTCSLKIGITLKLVWVMGEKKEKFAKRSYNKYTRAN